MSLVRMSHETGEMSVKAILAILIANTVGFLNVGKSMNDKQIAQTIDLILEDYSVYKIDYFVLCFNRAKKGWYGKQYDRIDGQVIFNWLAAFDEEYCREIEQARRNEKILMEKDTVLPEENKAVPMPEYVKETLKELRAKDIKQSIHKEISEEQKIINGFISDFNAALKDDISTGTRFIEVGGRFMDIQEYVNYRLKLLINP